MKNSILGNLFSNTKEYSVAKSSENIQENSMSKDLLSIKLI